MSTQLWQRKKCNENIIPIYLIVFNIRETFMINNVLHNECKMGLVNLNSICLHAGYCFITKFALVSWLIQLHIFFWREGNVPGLLFLPTNQFLYVCIHCDPLQGMLDKIRCHIHLLSIENFEESLCELLVQI